MNLQEIEKAFDEKFRKWGFIESIPSQWKRAKLGEKECGKEVVKNFIFQTVIPEVFKEVMPDSSKIKDTPGYKNGWHFSEAVEQFKQNAKEKFNITL